jgi:Phosphotransferase enzyme family
MADMEEVEAMAMAPIPTPEVLWRKPPVLALAALPGKALGRLAEIASHLDGECAWLVTNGVLPAELVTRNRQVAETALRSWTPVFTHGDLQVAHVFVDDDEITGVLDWTEAAQGDALFDLATLTLGHQEHLDDVLARLRGRRAENPAVRLRPGSAATAARRAHPRGPARSSRARPSSGPRGSSAAPLVRRPLSITGLVTLEYPASSARFTYGDWWRAFAEVLHRCRDADGVAGGGQDVRGGYGGDGAGGGVHV